MNLAFGRVKIGCNLLLLICKIVNIRRFIFAGFLSAISLSVLPQIATSNTAEKISSVAKDVTVIIDAKQSSGSGVIIGQKGTEYSVLTNWHVLKTGDTYSVKTKDGKTHQLNPSSIRQIGNLDLAVGTFTSSRSYRVVEMGNSDNISEGSTLYITGAPANLKGISSRNLLVVGGQLVGYNPTDSNGYTLIYNNNTMPGMSGGSVMDINGNLIGIHGRGSRDQNDQKSGFNLGIPINLFVSSANRLGLQFSLNRARIDTQKPSLVTPTFLQGRPRVVDGSEGANGACPGDRC